jgi:hypothetical protein
MSRNLDQSGICNTLDGAATIDQRIRGNEVRVIAMMIAMRGGVEHG